MEIRKLMPLVVFTIFLVDLAWCGRSTYADETKPIQRWVFEQGQSLRMLGEDQPIQWNNTPIWETGPAAAKLTEPKDGTAPAVVHDDISIAELPTDSLSVEAWVRIDEPRPWSAMMSAIQDNGSYERGWVLGTDATGLRFTFGVVSEETSRLTYLDSSESIIVGGWYHVVGAYDGVYQRLYVNGQESAVSKTQRGRIVYPDEGVVALGAYKDSSESHPLGGALASLSLFDRPLTKSEIEARFLGGRSRYKGAKPQEDWAMNHRTKSWSSYRGNNGRTGFVDLEFKNDLGLVWSHQSQAPSPAWPPPAAKSYWQNLTSIEPRVVDDQAIHPVLTDDAVIFGSSANDSVICLDRRSGEVRWRVTTGGPVRFAPVIFEDYVLIGSDDGLIRCVSLADGSLNWSQRVGQERTLISGNGRMISPFPLRSGVLVSEGVVYACAGLFPSQGVYVAAFEIDSGNQVWKHDLGDRSPQGYLLAASDQLIIPSGRGNPFSVNMKDGSIASSFQGVGGTYAVIQDDQLIAGRGNDNTLVGSKAETGQKLVTFPGEHLAVTPRYSFVGNRNNLAVIDRARSNALRKELAEINRRIEQGVKSAEIVNRRTEIELELPKCILWTVESERVLSLAASRDTVFVGLANAIEIRNVSDGKVRTRHEVNGEVRSIALAKDWLVATTDQGEVLSFGTWEAITESPQREGLSSVVSEETTREVEGWFVDADTDRGYTLVVEPTMEQLLAAEKFEGFRIVAVFEDEARLSSVRESLHEFGIYGTRISAHAISSGKLPFVDQFANIVVDPQQSVSIDELQRVAAPGRSVICIGSSREKTEPLEGAGQWTHQFANLSNSASSGDRYTSSELHLQWFGGPGPRRMVDRHLRAPPPLAAGGRTFVIGENRLIGVDSYNGTELWDTAIPDSQRYAMPYDAGYIACRPDAVFAAVDSDLVTLDARTGSEVRRHSLPESIREGHHWGYVGVDETIVYGSAMLPTAPRTNPGRHLSDQTYRSEQPIVTSRAFFRAHTESDEVDWIYERGVIIHPTITIHGGLVCFIEARGEDSRRNEEGKIPLTTLLKDDAWLVALDAETGEVVWEHEADLEGCRNIVYLVGADDRLICVGSGNNAKNDAEYRVTAYSLETGGELWRNRHVNQKPGQLYHGEQVHHPVVMGDLLVAEPFLYELETGKLVTPPGEPNDWSIKRPGHSCGTMSGANGCLFFRAGNPTVMDLNTDTTDRFQALSPSRVGCWINILPADGLVIIPEASSSCVCAYALQTSMAFRPVQPSNK